MGLDVAHYHPWQGKLRSPWRATGAIMRVTLSQIFRRKAYWIILALGLIQFLAYWVAIYLLTQIQMSGQAQKRMLQMFGFSPESSDPQSTGYLVFIEQQSMVVMILLAFCGSLVIGADFRGGVLSFYLSRRIDRRHYIIGKMLAVGAAIWLLTVVPALLLFLEYGLFTESLDYWIENWRVVPAIFGYGLVLGGTLALWSITLSAYLKKLVPIAVTWTSLFILLGRLAVFLRNSTGDRRWMLASPWYDIRQAGRMFFGEFRFPSDRAHSHYAAMIVAALCVAAVLLLVRKVRAVEVVT
jgi:ABC-type transport system involved in multi-copper enzyme maturation permease subunit